MRDGTRCSSVKNKANLSTRRTRCGEELAGQAPPYTEDVGRDARPTKSRLCETKPISGGRYTPPLHYSIIPLFQPLPIVRNKANFRESPGRTTHVAGTECAKQSCPVQNIYCHDWAREYPDRGSATAGGSPSSGSGSDGLTARSRSCVRAY